MAKLLHRGASIRLLHAQKWTGQPVHAFGPKQATSIIRTAYMLGPNAGCSVVNLEHELDISRPEKRAAHLAEVGVMNA